MSYRSVMLGMLVIAFFGAGAAAQGPALYVRAPIDDWGRTNLLAPEATLRTVAIEAAAGGADVHYLPAGQCESPPADALPRLEVAGRGSSGPNSLIFVLNTGRGECIEVADADFDRTSWQALTSSVCAACEDIMDEVKAELKLTASPAGRLSESDRAALANSLAVLCRRGPSAAAGQAAAIDRILSEHPSDSSVLTAACWPSAMLASCDLHGYFQLRSRFLAVPLGWHIAARRAGARGPHADITEAWVALLCGFPGETVDILDRFEAPASLAPLAAALEMFSTRDWRKLDAARAARATAIEQIAWLWALQECQLLTPHLGTVATMLGGRAHPAFGAVYDSQSVEGGHTVTTAMTAYAAASVFELARSLESRSPERVGPVMNVLPPELKGLDQEVFAARLLARFAEVEDENGSSGLLRAAVDTLRVALDMPDGPLSHNPGGPEWQSLSPWAQAQVIGGMLYRSLEQRAFFMFRTWSVPESAAAFIRKVIAEIGADEVPGRFFEICLPITQGRAGDATADFGQIIKFEMGRVEPATWHLYSDWIESRWLEEFARTRWRVFHHPCGAFQCELLAANAPENSTKKMYGNWYRLATANDPFNKIRARADEFEKADRRAVMKIARSIPYQYRMIRLMALKAYESGRYESAINLFRLGIQTAPDFILNYKDLARVYESMGENKTAIEVLREGLERAPRSVTAAHCQAMLQRLLAIEGDTGDSLEAGAAAARSYSLAGLNARARSLDAAGRYDEALAVYRDAAERYPKAAFTYLVYAHLCNRPGEEIERAARELAVAESGTPLAPYIAGPLMMYGRFDLAAELLNGPLAPKEDYVREAYWGDYYLMKQEFTEAARHYRQALDLEYLSQRRYSEPEYVAERAWIAMSLAGDTTGKAILREWFATFDLVTEKSRPLFKYMRGEATRNEAVKPADAATPPDINLYWLFAAESEAVGNNAEAARWYNKAVEHDWAKYSYAGCFARERLKHFRQTGTNGGP